MQAAVGEKLLISKADYFVMSRYSGFARQPAVQVRSQYHANPKLKCSSMRASKLRTPHVGVQARRWTSLFVLNGFFQRNCSAMHANQLSEVALHPPGL